MSNYLFIVFGFVIAFLISYLMTPLIRKIALNNRLLSMPGRRRVHIRPKPYLGGISIYCAFIFGIFLVSYMNGASGAGIIRKLAGLVIGCTLIVLLGLWDDIKNMKPLSKLVGQIVIVSILFGSGLRISVFQGQSFYPNSWVGLFLDAILTMAWFVGIINAVNLIDGLDGLAAGIAVIASESLIFVSLYRGDFVSAALLAVLCGSALGFLKFNFYPAKIFMGDSGSMLLGLILASIGLFGTQQKAITVVSLLIPLTALTIPVFDTFVAIIRRASKKRPVFKADKKHIHHRLLDMGLTQKQVVLWLYTVTAYLGLFSFLFMLIPPEHALVLLLLLMIGLVIAAEIFEFIERKTRLICRLEKELEEK